MVEAIAGEEPFTMVFEIEEERDRGKYMLNVERQRGGGLL